MTESEDKGFKVEDRRFSQQSDEEKARILEEEASQKAKTQDRPEATSPKPEAPLPEINFSAFIISLSSSAFIHLGDIPDPTTGETAKNLPLAKQAIDLMGLLREKTRNNLAQDEEKLFEHLLYDLRMRYIKEAG
jgi:hypothetical protein